MNSRRESQDVKREEMESRYNKVNLNNIRAFFFSLSACVNTSEGFLHRPHLTSMKEFP